MGVLCIMTACSRSCTSPQNKSLPCSSPSGSPPPSLPPPTSRRPTGYGEGGILPPALRSKQYDNSAGGRRDADGRTTRSSFSFYLFISMVHIAFFFFCRLFYFPLLFSGPRIWPPTGSPPPASGACGCRRRHGLTKHVRGWFWLRGPASRKKRRVHGGSGGASALGHRDQACGAA